MYKRDYLLNDNTQMIDSSQEKILRFLKATYQLFAGSLLSATAGAYIGLSIVHLLVGPISWILFAIELGLIFFVVPRVKDIPGVNLAVLFAFTFITGLTIAPLLSSIFAMPSGAAIVGQAFLMTAIAFGGISMFAMTTKRDFSSMGKMLFISLIIFIVAAISNIFIQSSMLQLGIASVGAILFSAFILYDTQNIIKGNYSSPIEAALALYLDFLNLFISLIQLLGIANSKSND